MPHSRLDCLIVWLAAIFVFATQLAAGSSESQVSARPQETLPRIVSAPDLVYPKVALAARVSGTVELFIKTDGKRVVLIEGEKGPMMLRPSAEENVRAWIFEEHAPTSFAATFEYKLLDVHGCVEARRGVIRVLPTRIEIDDAPVTCDWDRYNRQQKYLREQHVCPVELHVTANEEPVAIPTEVKIIRGQEVFTLPVRENLFLVPEELSKESALTFRAVVGKEIVEISAINGSALKCGWNLELPKKVPLDAKARSLGLDGPHSCILGFDPLDGDGAAMMVTPCRKKF
jgi:hypothetical protein